jgi:hypothetical protein
MLLLGFAELPNYILTVDRGDAVDVAQVRWRVKMPSISEVQALGTKPVYQAAVHIFAKFRESRWCKTPAEACQDLSDVINALPMKVSGTAMNPKPINLVGMRLDRKGP